MSRQADLPSRFRRLFDRADRLDQIDPMLADLMVGSGQMDGNPTDDKISVSKASFSASALKPSQTSMVLGKSIGMALWMLESGKVGGDLGALISSDNHIMDGHHRWSATVLAAGSRGKVGGYQAKLPGKHLLRVLNLLTKGQFNVRGGKSGKGALSGYTEGNVLKAMEKAVEAGIPAGEFSWSPERVRGVLEASFGSVEAGVAQMSANVKKLSHSVPSWAPDRKQMPVIEPNNVPKAVKMLQDGVVDWNDPHRKEALRAATIRLAHASPELRPHLLPLLVG